MTQINPYSMRQAILRELKEMRGAPLRCQDLLAVTSEPALTLADPAAVRGQWSELQQFGYVEAIPGFGGMYCRISERGLRQLAPEFPQDPFVWGPAAK